MKILFFVIILNFSILKTNAFINKPLDTIKNNKVEKLSNCKAKFDNGSIIDLSSLDNPSSPLSTLDDSKMFEYKFNPCTPISCESNSLKTSAVCQKQLRDKLEFNSGDQNTADFSFQDSLVITYKLGNKTSRIICYCSEDQQLTFFSESPKQNYQLKLSSPCCCADKCIGKNPDKGGIGLGLGYILIIIFISTIVVYFISGFMYLKFFKNKTGIDTIPIPGISSKKN
ncbi:unnamed protein product [Brachionus calyciflorus]|uniref:MRH domain-containing protein n=1 Tax=Brachionus calyciflorus TaxID=104777 RepID=A0A813XWZ7_9BILA|nr:unnamed protein product [Brachionus calyciflorus]